MKRFYPLLILSLLILTSQAFAVGIVKGVVIDKRTGEPLIGSTVTVKNAASGKKISASVGLDGSFIFRNLTAGAYEVEARYVSYKDEEAHVTVTDNATANVRLLLSPKAKDLAEVSVRGRASNESDQSARRVEQRADQLVNAVSART